MANTIVWAPVAEMPTRRGGDEPGYDVTLSGGVITMGKERKGDVAVIRFPDYSAYRVPPKNMPMGSGEPLRLEGVSVRKHRGA